MGNQSGRITAPVNTDDICAVLGISTHDVVTLCSSDKINPWARNKPENIVGYETITDSQRKRNNFSLTVDSTNVKTSVSAFITMLKNMIAEKKYDCGVKYNNTTSSYRRMDDFVGYNHSAPSPFGVLPPFEGYLSSAPSSKLIIPCIGPSSNPQTAQANGIIDISEFESPSLPLKDWYFGIVLLEALQKNDYLVATMTTPVSGDGSDIMHVWQVDFGHINPNKAGFYIGFPILSSKILSPTKTTPSGLQIIGIGSDTVSVVLLDKADQLTTRITCMYNSYGSTILRYSASITNNTNSAITLGRIVVEVATNNSGANVKTLLSTTNVDISANGLWDSSGVWNASQSNYTHARISYTVGSQSYVGSWVAFMLPDGTLDPDLT